MDRDWKSKCILYLNEMSNTLFFTKTPIREKKCFLFVEKSHAIFYALKASLVLANRKKTYNFVSTFVIRQTSAKWLLFFFSLLISSFQCLFLKSLPTELFQFIFMSLLTLFHHPNQFQTDVGKSKELELIDMA